MSGRRRLAWTALTATAWLWLVMLAAAPALRHAPQPAAAMGAAMAYLTGATVCHQRPERAFALAGQPLPVCARCTGLYAGGAAGLLLWALRRRRASAAVTRRWLVHGLAVTAVPTVLSVGAAWGVGVDTPNLPRALLAVPLGVMVGGALAAAARGDADDPVEVR